MTSTPKLVIGLDPGYATQGIAIVGLDPEPRLLGLHATTTDNEYDQHTRSQWQLDKALAVLSPFMSYGRLPALLVLEEFHASAFGKSPPMNAYYRGWYDCMLRERVSSRFASAITVHAQHVRLWSGNFQKVPQKKESSTPDETASFLLKIASNLFDGQLVDHLKLDCLGKKQTAKSCVVHAADSLVMAVMGIAAYVKPEWSRGRTPQQQGWIKKIHETYPQSIFQTEGGVR